MNNAIVDVTAVAVDGKAPLHVGGPGRYDYGRLPERLRNQVKLAQGTVVTKLSGTVESVIDAGNTLRWAKDTLPHGEYLPWVQLACGLKPDYAARLIKAAEWAANMEHVPHLDRITDVAILFALSADSTTDADRAWYLDQVAAGAQVSRAEFQARKRRAAGKPPAPRPVELQALTLYRKAQTVEMDAALALARQITTVSELEMLQEVGLREAPKVKVLPALAADFHRRPDGSGWDRIPHAGRIEVQPPPPAPAVAVEVLPLEDAAARIGIKPLSLKNQLALKRNADGICRAGCRLKRAGRGHVQLEVLP